MPCFSARRRRSGSGIGEVHTEQYLCSLKEDCYAFMLNISRQSRGFHESFWIPACAGMTSIPTRLIFARYSRASGNPEKQNGWRCVTPLERCREGDEVHTEQVDEGRRGSAAVMRDIAGAVSRGGRRCQEGEKYYLGERALTRDSRDKARKKGGRRPERRPPSLGSEVYYFVANWATSVEPSMAVTEVVPEVMTLSTRSKYPVPTNFWWLIAR